MIRTRVIVGLLLAAVAAAVLVGDAELAPWFPCLFGCLLAVGLLSGRELVRLFPPAARPPEWFVLGGVALVLGANWYPVLVPSAAWPWESVLFVFTAVLLAAFVVEMARYREPGAAVPRLALAVLAVAYLGLLGSCFARMRWLDHGGLLLALTVFVTKGADVGAFFTGTFLGRHKMTPVLSPKKTWEGFAGGLVVSVLVAVGLSRLGPVFASVTEAAVFGVTVGTAGVLGDLAESMVKRDALAKDAAKSIPGFGGVLDVVDSILFAAPVAYLWFRL